MRYTINDCREWAAERNGFCISHFYKNTKTKMEWKCKRNHEWEDNFYNIKKLKYHIGRNVFDIIK